MAHEIAALLKEYADVQRIFAKTDLPDAEENETVGTALRRGFMALYDALKVTWFPCEERMPDSLRDVWVHPFEDTDDVGFAPIASWSINEWWADDRPLETPGFTHWAEIAWPEPPQKEGGDANAKDR